MGPDRTLVILKALLCSQPPFSRTAISYLNSELPTSPWKLGNLGPWLQSTNTCISRSYRPGSWHSSVLSSYVLNSRMFLGSVAITPRRCCYSTQGYCAARSPAALYSVCSWELPGPHGEILEQPLTSRGPLFSSSSFFFFFLLYPIYPSLSVLLPSSLSMFPNTVPSTTSFCI